MNKSTSLVYLLILAFSTTLFLSCEKKRTRGHRSSSSSHSKSVTVADTSDTLADEYILLVNQAADIMFTIKDKDSAIQSEDKLNNIADDFEALAERFENLEDPSPEEIQRNETKWRVVKKELGKKEAKRFQELGKTPDLIEEMEKSMKDFVQRMEKMQPTFEKFGLD